MKIKLKFYGIDSHQRPVFAAKKGTDGSIDFYGCLDKLAPSSRNAVQDTKFVKSIKAKDLVYFGTSFDCEPMGTAPGVTLIIEGAAPEGPVYVLELTSEQTKLVERALDTYSRILAGELEESAVVLRHNHNFEKKSENPIPWENLLLLEDRLGDLKHLMGLERSGNHGIFSHVISDNARKAYDILKTVAHCRYTTEVEGKHTWSHWHDEPVKTSFDKDYTLPVVTVKTT